MLKTQKVFWWRTGSANTEGKLGKEPDGEMGSYCSCLKELKFCEVSENPKYSIC
jgi:hypothetical protein